MAAVVLCGAMARASEKEKKVRAMTAAYIQEAGETVRRLQAARKTKADKQGQVRDTLEPTAAKSPPAKRSKKQHQQEHIRRRGSGSGSGTAKSSGSKDVVVLSDVEGSEKKLRGRGEEPAVQHEPAVKKKLRGCGEEARVLTRSEVYRKPDEGRQYGL